MKDEESGVSLRSGAILPSRRCAVAAATRLSSSLPLHPSSLELPVAPPPRAAILAGMKVQVLPQTLINQIAAGEVVVNMASVAKELVENAIDAGARNIDIELSDDLRDLVVADDGHGMDRDDAELALQRHATSKIRTSDDLFNLATRGFRGEALPSIASVSRVEIATRPHASLAGTRFVVDGGRIERIESAGCLPGTRIAVRDLFFNTPARRKFLKSDVAEMNDIVRTLTRQALAAHATGFRVVRGGETRLSLKSGDSRADRFLALAGNVARADLLELHGDGGAIGVSGFLVQPQHARGNRSSQYLFVNGRPFSSKPISAAIEQACRGFIMVGRFPAFCAFVDVPPGEVDINVHPTKEEVRFRNERAVAGACYHAARAALEARGYVPEMSLGSDAPSNASDGVMRVETAFVPPPRAAVQETFLSSPELLVNRAFEKKRARDLQQADWAALAQQRLGAQPVAPEFSPAVAPAIEEPRLQLDHTTGEAVVDAGSQPISAGPGEKPDPDFWNKPFEPEPLGQIAWTYIVVRFGEDLLLVDQHAAHERIRYLELQSRAARIASQPLLVPQVFDIAAGRDHLARRLVPVLRATGFEIEPFGGRSWQVAAVPADLPSIDAGAMVADLIDEFEELGTTAGVDELRQRILVRAACHSSIRAGHVLSTEEMAELLRLMRVHRLSFTCPHGRPTVVRLSKHELDRKFGRLH